MRRDAIYYQLFKRCPSLIFMLLDDRPESAQDYKFESIEIKETSFRIDGVFLPPENTESKIVYFCEVQLQRDDELYARFFSESFLSLYRNLDAFDNWYGVLIFRSRRLIPKNKKMFQALIDSSQVKQIFLDELGSKQTNTLGIRLLQLPILPKSKMIGKAKELIGQIQNENDTILPKQAIIEMISTIAVYKFSNLKREEVEEMLGLSLEETRVYQDAMAEGQLKEALALVLKQLSRRIGDIPPALKTQIEALPLTQVESLAEALLDFSEPADLVNWLQSLS